MVVVVDGQVTCIASINTNNYSVSTIYMIILHPFDSLLRTLNFCPWVPMIQCFVWIVINIVLAVSHSHRAGLGRNGSQSR